MSNANGCIKYHNADLFPRNCTESDLHATVGRSVACEKDITVSYLHTVQDGTYHYVGLALYD